MVHLGGNFGPEKKYLAPPQKKKSPQTPSRPLDPPPPNCPAEPPPLGIFNKNRPPPPPLPAPRTSPSRKNKKYPKRPPTSFMHIWSRDKQTRDSQRWRREIRCQKGAPKQPRSITNTHPKHNQQHPHILPDANFDVLMFVVYFPKDPSVLKIVQRSNL